MFRKITNRNETFIFRIVFENILFRFYLAVSIAIYISTCFSSTPDKLVLIYFFHAPLFCAGAGILTFQAGSIETGTGENLVGWKDYGEGPMEDKNVIRGRTPQGHYITGKSPFDTDFGLWSAEVLFKIKISIVKIKFYLQSEI